VDVESRKPNTPFGNGVVENAINTISSEDSIGKY
jgi:hypothetical protein